MSKRNILNALLILVSCVLFMHLIQDYALKKSKELNKDFQPLPMLSTFQVLHQDKEWESEEGKQETMDRNIWITMSVCWSSNTKYHGKEKFPYTKAAIMSSTLWHKLTKAKVILQVVYSEFNVTNKLIKYKKTLEEVGVRVILVPANNMECVLKAQIIRVLVFQQPFVQPNDIVVTADVDAFVMTSNITKPLTILSSKKIWIYRYQLTQQTGYTFMMPFIGAVASTWEKILDYDNTTGIPGMIQTYKKKMKMDDSYTWDVDQHIVTHSILNSRLCTLPKENNLWKELNLEYQNVNDKETCWHGGGIYEDCNNKLTARNLMIRYQGFECKWWHFYPDETEVELKAKFKEIMSGEVGNQFIDTLLDVSKKIQLKTFGKIFTF